MPPLYLTGGMWFADFISGIDSGMAQKRLCARGLYQERLKTAITSFIGKK